MQLPNIPKRRCYLMQLRSQMPLKRCTIIQESKEDNLTFNIYVFVHKRKEGYLFLSDIVQLGIIEPHTFFSTWDNLLIVH